MGFLICLTGGFSVAFFSVTTFSSAVIAELSVGLLGRTSSFTSFLTTLFLLGFSTLARGFSVFVSSLEGVAACMSKI